MLKEHTPKCFSAYIKILGEFIEEDKMRKLKYQEVYDFVKNRGCELLSKEYIGFDNKLEIRFSCGHVAKRSFHKFKSNSNVCPNCSSNKQHSEEEIISKFKEQGFLLEKGKYIGNANTPLDVIDLDGYKYRFSYHAFDNTYNKRKQKKHFVAKDNIYALENMFLWIEKENKPYSLSCDKYLGGHTRNIKAKCNSCKNVWTTCWSDLFSNGHLCPLCQIKNVADQGRKRNVSEENNLKVEFPFLAEEWNYEKNMRNPDEYSSKSNMRVHWLCSCCGAEWEAPIYSRTSGHGCSVCSQSGGEKRIYYFLKENNICFKPQFSFDDLLSDLGNPLRFDFAILDKDIPVRLVEFDGGQHDRYIPFIHKNIENFYSSQKRDKMKDDYCKEHGIPLIRIPEKEFKNIESILSKELNLPSSEKGGIFN